VAALRLRSLMIAKKAAAPDYLRCAIPDLSCFYRRRECVRMHCGDLAMDNQPDIEIDA
jgi:hypothetical protein